MIEIANIRWLEQNTLSFLSLPCISPVFAAPMKGDRKCCDNYRSLLDIKVAYYYFFTFFKNKKLKIWKFYENLRHRKILWENNWK